jgi:MFS family permease
MAINSFFQPSDYSLENIFVVSSTQKEGSAMTIRTMLAVFLGYLIFAFSAAILFHAADVDPHAPTGFGFGSFTAIYGLVFAVAAGFIAGRVGRRHDLACGIGVAVLIAAGATLSLIASPGAHARWSQLVALVLCSPAALAGDWMRRRRLQAAG